MMVSIDNWINTADEMRKKDETINLVKAASKHFDLILLVYYNNDEEAEVDQKRSKFDWIEIRDKYRVRIKSA